MEGYAKINPAVWVEENSKGPISAVDSLVLDIDGVILDVSASFRVAISKTTQYFFENVLGWQVKGGLITPAETEFFKTAGGFNNDWELTYAVCLYYLVRGWKGEGGSKGRPSLAKTAGGLESFTRSLGRAGGGLGVAEEVALQGLSAEAREAVSSLWDKDQIKHIFQEYYGGRSHCRALYGFDPSRIEGPGLVESEQVIVASELIGRFSPRVGILTGRTEKEAQLALKMSGLSGLIADEFVIADGALRKPDPETLAELGRRMDVGTGIYVGDTVDDFQTVVNFRELDSDTVFLAGIVLRPGVPTDVFVHGRAELIAHSTNELLSTVLDLGFP